MLKKLSLAGNKGVQIVASVLAAVFIFAGLLTLWDMYRTEINAFASYDLLKYRPDIENREPPYLDELLKINPDTAGWLTMYGTNIDYPVFQGETDTEYLNKDAYGEFAISGSIFLSMINKKDFSDPYNLVYGHHMENGSMFGDIDKFNRKSFFFNLNRQRYKREEGVLIQDNHIYDLHVFALLKTDAYDHEVYRADKTEDEMKQFLGYVGKNAKFFQPQKNIEKVLAMSTCDSAATAGRTVLFCSMTPRTDPLPPREEEKTARHLAIGHPLAGAYWALLDLAEMLLSLYIAFPAHIAVSKENRGRGKGKGKRRRNRAALIATCIVSVTLFTLTQDMHRPLQMVDVYTPVFIILAITAWNIQKQLLQSGERNDNNKKREDSLGSDGYAFLSDMLSDPFLRIRQS